MTKTYLITGGAGFVGSHLAVQIKKNQEDVRVVALDNLVRRGSELHLPELRAHGVEFIRGDVRSVDDLRSVGKVDALIECSAEPSVLAGLNESPRYVVDTNLGGTINCLEVARENDCPIIFLSTSRVYPYGGINALKYKEGATRFELDASQKFPIGVSERGLNEDFSLNGLRSLYGATKLASELIMNEYVGLYKIPGVINRFGVIAGPGQMGKIDQGVVVLWIASHVYGENLSYLGFGGRGKQLRDALHVDDVYDLVAAQLGNIGALSGMTFNVGGGAQGSISLCELTSLCQDISGKKVAITARDEDRYADIRWYVTDNTLVSKTIGWQPRHGIKKIVEDIYNWVERNKESLRSVLSREIKK